VPNRGYLRFGESLVSWRDATYQKIANLGSGGSSNAYLTLATSGPNKGIAFAIKVLAREDWRLNFMREIHVLRTCDHPAIMKVVDEGVYLDRFPFLVMEYLPQTLSKALQAKSLVDEQRLNIVMQVLSALSYLSRREPPIVHRDIKPSNIFLKAVTCVLGDFGIIVQVDETKLHRAEESARKDVPEMARRYRTPELVAHHNGGPSPQPISDVFQLGLVAAEMFTGKNPLVPDNSGQPIKLNKIDDIQGPLGPTIKELIEQMLAEDKANRPTASKQLSAWQGLYLDFRNRQYNEQRIRKIQSVDAI
jgi:serine/threonine protein kinase